MADPQHPALDPRVVDPRVADPPAVDPRAVEETAAALRRGATRLSRRLRAERPPGALSGNKVSVLSYLYRHGAATPGEVAAHEHQQPQSLTRVLAELRAGGLVTGVPSPLDGRRVVLTLTSAGRRAVEDDMTSRDVWLASVLATLPGTEVDLLRIAATILDRLADA